MQVSVQLAWLDNTKTTLPQEHEKAKDALHWAALSYVVAALASVATLLPIHSHIFK